MAEWWTSLSFALQLFYAIAIFASVILVVQTLLLIIGVGLDDFTIGDFNHGGPETHPSGLGFLSVRTITAFLTGFGWTGVLVLQKGGSVGLAVAVAAVAGFLLAWTIVWLMRSMQKLAHDGSLNYANAIGQIGTVYVTIPARAGTGGQIEVMVQGRLCTVAAISKGDAAIAPGAKVRVAELFNPTTLVVTPF